MPSPQERVVALVDRVRARRPFVDHLVRMQGHYGGVKAGQQAGAVTYFGFLSFFPILALSFFVVGYVSRIYPEANANLRDAIDALLPGIIGRDEGQLQLGDFRTFSGLAGIVGLLGVLYAGLGWISALRDALSVVFETSGLDQPNFFLGKLRDLITLVAIGLVLTVAVAVTGFVSAFSTTVLELVGLDAALAWLVRVLAVLLGLVANALLFSVMFTLLAKPAAPRRSLWSGAVLGALGFEVLKQVSQYLFAATKGQPAFQAFGIALILVVWINYFSRVVLYAASFAHTSAAARALREGLEGRAVATPESVSASVQAAGSLSGGAAEQERPVRATEPGRTAWMAGFVDRIDAADPDDVGQDSAEAARQARERRQDGVRARLLALGAAGGAAGLLARIIVRRRER